MIQLPKITSISSKIPIPPRINYLVTLKSVSDLHYLRNLVLQERNILRIHHSMQDMLTAMKNQPEIIKHSADKLQRLHNLNLKMLFKVKEIVQIDYKAY